ncbi:MAG: tetratricopeptide repeat protein, partial [Desulfobacterales bacterium]|nr:tetratricopeptide repeat protein [Desulfobacterales bacterium]
LKNYKNLKPDESFDGDYNPDDMTVLLPRKNKFGIIKLITISMLVMVIFAAIFFIYYKINTSIEGGGYASKGEKFIEEKNYNKAIDNLNKVLASDPEDFNAYYLLGLAYQKKGLFDESIVHYIKAIEMNKSFAPSYKGLAEVYEEKGEVKQAISFNEQYIQLFPQAEDTALVKTKLLALKDSLASDESVESIKTAEIENKENDKSKQKDLTENAYENGKKLFENQDYAQAIINFQKVLKDDPENEDVKRYIKLATHEEEKREEIALNRSLGLQSYESKNYLQAAIYFNEILNLDPDNQDAKKYVVLIRQGVLDAKIEEVIKPAIIRERPFYKRTVKVLALDPDQARKFENIYSINGKKLEQQLQESMGEKEKSQALKTFSTQTYSELRKTLRTEQVVKLDNLIAAGKERRTQLLDSKEKPEENKSTPSAASDKTANEEKTIDTIKDQNDPKAGSAGTERSTTEASDEASGVSKDTENIAQSLSLGIQAYNGKNYNQATIYFNEVLKLEPNNAEAKKYLEYIKLAKIKMMNDQTASEVDNEKKDTDEADLPEGL